MRPLRSALAAVALLVAVAPAAAAHAGDDRGPSNHRIAVDDATPVDGVRVRLVEAETRIELTSTRDDEVVVLGYGDEPYLRIGPDGVFQNVRSPAVYLNTSYDGGPVPSDASTTAEPEWERVDDGRTARWHDHRFHPPPRPADLEWAIPLVVGGRPASVTGVIDWVAPPPVWPWLVLAAALAGLVLWRPRLLVAALVAAVAADAVRAVGITAEVGGGVATFLEVVRFSAFGWAAAAGAALAAGRRRPTDALTAAALAGAALAIGGGLLELGDIGTSQLATALPATGARAAVAVVLGTGAGVAATGARSLLRPGTR